VQLLSVCERELQLGDPALVEVELERDERHPLPLDQIEVELSLDPSLPGVRIAAQARTAAKTGVEMEALTAVAVASLTIYDMVKSADRAMSIEAIRLTHKAGGRSGEYVAPDAGPLKEDR